MRDKSNFGCDTNESLDSINNTSKMKHLNKIMYSSRMSKQHEMEENRNHRRSKDE